MSEYRVKMIVGGRISTSVTVQANNAADASRLARLLYAGSDVRVLETNRVR